MHRLASITSTGLGAVLYTYDTYGKLIKISRGTTEYNLTYDTWNRPLETKVGTTALSTNTYDSYGKLLTVTYANGFSARYEYDNLDRVSKIYQTENNTESLVYEMIYNGEGDLYELRNYRTLRASFFDYDHAGRCMASKERSFSLSGSTISYGNMISSYAYKYDECNNLTKLTCSVASSTWSTTYTYDKDNRSKTTTLSSGKVLTNTYDSIGRLASRKIGLSSDYITTLTYVPGNGTNKTTGLVSAYQNGSDDAYTYTYDDNGNITEITQGTTSITYEYDTANRLTRENNGLTNETVTYEYDTWGNILNKKIYAYTTGDLTNVPYTEIEYEYTNTAWGDQLTSYDGQTITYDGMGNPTSYRGYTFGWRGKQLTSASNGTNSLTFEYNEDGLRQKKTVNNVDTDYFYNGSVLIGMQQNTDTLLFSYDASGSVVSVNYNGTEYYYLRNAQGDIVKLIDASGAVMVEYTYDTWGKEVQTTGSLAGTLGSFQPFRYRGYVYDEETGLYYLQSRYYDPEVERFISADVLLSTGQGVMGHNAYAYCLDNPVNMQDNSGHAANWAVSVMMADGGSGGKSIRYNVPLYNQGDTSLCWAYCQVMIESYREGEILTQTQANERAKQIAQEVFGSTDKNDWNQGNYPQDIIDGMWADEISCQDLYDLLVKHGPLYGFYGCEGGHYIVITGVNVSTNTVYTNNPWGSSNSQLFEDFLMGISFNDEFYEMQLETVWWTK